MPGKENLLATGISKGIKNQQIVLEGVLKKALSSTTILTKYTSLLNAVEDNVEINMSQKDMQKLIKMQMDGMPSWNIQKQSITGTPDSKICFSTGDYYVAVVDVDQKSVISARGQNRSRHGR